MKTCTGCKIDKPFSEFTKDKKAKDGLNYWCKECRKYYRINNKKSIKERTREYYLKNKEAIYLKNITWQKENYTRLGEYRREYYYKNKERILKNNKIYRERNKHYNGDYCRKRRAVDPLFKFTNNLRSLTCYAFKNKSWAKNTKTQEILGADYKTVFNHIESRFKKGMSWDNRGEWHIDHIIPLSSAKTEDELIKLCHYTNLQPLWAEENLKKGSKIIACKL